jgi:hypothetical protein
MKIIKLTLLGLVLGIGPTLYADPSGAPSVSSADPITEALPILQAKFPDFKSLNYKTGDHLSDLIARSNGEISLTPPADSPSSAIITANLPGDILYWRLATFTPAKSWADLETQLSQSSPTSAGIILDLRSNSAPDDYAGAAQVMALLDPANHVLAQFQAVNLPPAPALRHLPIVLLVNGQTTGAAEALAAFLKADGALVVGRATKGDAAVYQEQKLASGQTLRFVSENLSLANGNPLFGHPVMPDITPNINDHNEKAALVLIRANQILDVIQESEQRHRMSEAALVQGQDPEWDDYLASFEQKPVLLSLPVIHDVALISALDSLKAIRLSQRTVPPPSTASIATPTSSSVQ